MNGPKLTFILTCLFLICIIFTISEIYAFNYDNDNDWNDFYNILLVANCVVAVLIIFNFFAYKFKQPSLYQWSKYGFALSFIGCFLLLCFNVISMFIYCSPDSFRKCRDEYGIIPYSCFPLLPLSLAGFFLTSNFHNNHKKQKTKFHCHKITYHYNVLTSIIIILTIGFYGYAKPIFDNLALALLSIYVISAIAILFNVIVFATKKWSLYIPVIIGYGINALGNLIVFGMLLWEESNIPHVDWFWFIEFLFAFVPIMLYTICGIFGLILTLSSYKNGKKTIGILAAATTMPFTLNPK